MAAKAPAAQAKAKVGRSTKSGSKSETPGGAAPKKAASPKRASVAAPAAGDAQGAPPPDDPAAAAAAAAGQLAPPPPKRGSIAKAASEGSGDSGKAKSAGSAKSKDSPKAKAAAGKAPSKSAQPAKAAPKAAKASAKAPAAKAKAGAKAASPKADSPAEPPVPAGEPAAEDVQSVLERLEGDWQPQDQREKREKIREGALIIAEDGTSAAITAEGSDKISVERDGAVKTATLSSDGELLWEDGSVWVRPAKEMLDTGASLMTEGNGSEALGEQPPAEQPAEEPGPAEDSPPPAEDRPPPADDGSAPAAPEAAAAPSPETADGEEAPEAVEDAKPADTTPTPADIQGLWTPRSRPDLVVLMQDGILILPDGVQTSYEVLPDGLFKFTKIDGTTEEARIKEGGELHFGDRVPDEVDGNLLMELRDAVSSGEIGGDVGGIEDNVISTDNIIFREGQVWERSRSLKWSLKVENLDFESLLSDPSLVKMASQIIEDAVAEITLLKPWQIRLELVYQEQAEEQPGQPGGTSVTVLANMGVASQGDNNDEEVMKRLHEGCEDMDSRIMDEIMLVPELHIIMTELQLRVTSSVSKQPAEEVSVKDVKKRARTLTLGGTELIKYMVSPSSSEDLAPLGRAATAPAERRATSMMRGKAKAYIQSVMKSSTFATRLASTGAAAEGEDDMEVTRLRSADFDKDLGQRWSVAAEEYKEAAFSLSSQILDLQDVLTSEAAEAKKLRKELKKEDQRRQVLTKDVAELHERLAESRDIVVKAEHKTSELIAEMMDEWDQRDEAAMLAAKGSKVGPRMHPDDLDVFQRTTAMLWNWTRMAGGILAAATAAAGRNLEVLVAASGQDRANLQLTMGAAAHESMMMAAVLRWCYLAAFMVRRAEEMEGPWWSITIHRNCVGKLVDLFRAGLLTMPGHSHSLGGGHGLSYGLSGGDEEEGVSRKTHNDTLCAWVRLVLILELYETHPILAKKRKPQISDNVSAIMATMPWKWVRLVDRLLRYSGLEDYNSDVAGLVRKLTTFASRSRVATGATAVTAATFETAHSEFVGGVGSLQNTPPEEFVGGVGSLEYTLSDVSRVGSEPTTPQVPSRDADLVWVQFACMLVARWKFGVLRASRDWIRLVVSAAWRAHAAASPAVLRSAVVETRDATRIEPVAKKWIRLVAKRLLGKNTGLFADRLKLVIGHDRELRRLRAQILESRAEATEAFREHGRLAGERVGIFESEVEACRAREAALEEEIQEHRGVAVDQAWSATTAEERLRSLHTDLLTAREAALLSVASARADLVEALDRAATSSHAAESLAGEAAGLRAGAKEQQQRIETILVMQEAAFSELNTHWEQRNAASVAAAKLESPEVKATAQRLSEIEPGPDVEKVLAEVEAMRQAAVVQAKHSDEVISAHRVLFNEMHEQWVRDSQDVDATQDLLRTEYAEARTQEECVRADLIVALSKLAKHEQATHQSQHIMQMQREALFEMQEHMASCGDASAAPQASEEDSQGAPPPSASAAIAASPAAAAAAAALAELGDVGGAIAASPTAAAAAAALAELADVGAGDAAGGLEKQADGVREAYDGGTASAGPPMLPGLGHRAAARAAAAVAAAEPGLEAELREQEEDPSLASGMRRINLGFGELSEAMRQINQGVIQVDDALMPIRSTSSEEAMEARDAVKKAVEQNLSVQDHIGDLRESLETMKMWSQDIDRFHAQMEGQERQLAEESRLAGHLEKVSDDLRLENLALRSAAGGDLLPIQATPRDELEIGHSAMGAMQDWAADALLPAAAPSPDSPLAATGGGGGSGGGVGSDGGRLDVVAELDQQPTDAQSADMRRLVEAAVQEVSSQREAVLELREQLVNAAENAQLSDNRIQDLQAELREAGLQNSRLESQMQQRSPDPSPPRPRADAPGAPRSPAAGAGAGGGGGGEGGGEPLSPRTATALEEQAVTSERLRAAREELAHMKEEMREMKEASAAQEQQFREDMVSSVLEMKDQLQYIPQSVAREVVSQEADRWRRTHLAGDGSTSAAAAPPEAARTESERLRQQLHQLRSDDPVLAAPASVRSSFTSFMLGGSGLPRLPEDDGLPTTSSPPTPRRPESIGTGGPSVSETELLVHAQDFRGFNFSAHRVSLVSPLGEPEPERGTPRPTPRSGLEPEPEGHSPGTQGGGSSGSGQGPPQPRAASSGADLAAQVVPAPVPVSVWQWARLFALTVRSADAEARRAASQAAGRSVELARRWARLLVVILQTWQPTRESGFRQAALLLAGKVASVRGVAAEAQHRARLHAKHALTVQQLMIKDSQKRLASCTRIGRREKLQETLEQRGAGLLEMSRKLLLVSDDDWSEATSPWSPRSVGGGSSKDRSRLGSPR